MKVRLFSQLKTRAAKISCVMACFFLLSGMRDSSIVDIPTEYQLKAVFLFNFTQFVAWPEKSFDDEKAPFVIGILGKNPYGGFLEQTVRGESVSGHRIAVRLYDNIEEIKTCHMLYINLKDEHELREALASAKNHNILTVGDASRFNQLGGIIGFIMTNNKVRIRINLAAANATDLAISSKLLRLATIVNVKSN